MYKIRGSDNKEYGPVSAEVLKQWIAQGRVNGQTLALADGVTAWKPLSEQPEFSEVFGPPRPPTLSASRPMAPPTLAPMPAQAGQPRTSGLAVASIILGALGCLGITALAGLVTGIISLVKIRKSQGALEGKGLAIGGICLSVFMLLVSMLMVVWFSMFFKTANRAFTQARGSAQSIHCVSNVKQLALGVLIYANDHQDTLPAAAGWCDAIQKDVGSPAAFVCSANPGQRCGYAFNAKLGGLKTDKVDPNTVMIFECPGGWNVSGGPAQMISRHGQTYVVGLADGSVRQVSFSQISSLRWDP
jgi:hypothetical protein